MTTLFCSVRQKWIVIVSKLVLECPCHIFSRSVTVLDLRQHSLEGLIWILLILKVMNYLEKHFQSFSQVRSSGYDYRADHDDNDHDDLDDHSHSVRHDQDDNDPDAPLKVAGLMEPDGQREAKAAIVFSSTNVLLKENYCFLWYSLNCYVSRYFKL